MPKKKKAEAWKMKKSYLTGFANWLNNLSLSGKESRMRSRFVQKLAASIQLTEKERQQIIQKLVPKDKEGKPKTKTVDNGMVQLDIPKKDAKKFSEEMQELYNEEYVMNVTPETEELIHCIRDIVLETEYKFGPTGEEETNEDKQKKIMEANDYLVWCESFEELT
jgi:hypothetical protein